MNDLPFTEKELSILGKLDTPSKIQSFINEIPINFEEDGKDSCMSPRMVLRKKKAHCIEAAFLAAAALNLHGFKPLIVDMKGAENDCDHVIAVFQDKKTGQWGAISKTNHPVLRYREPVYKDIRELVMSYFHEYSDSSGNKTLREYSMPIDLSVFDSIWMISEENLWEIYDYLDNAKHFRILAKEQEKNLRKQDEIEIFLDKIVEWSRGKKRKNKLGLKLE